MRFLRTPLAASRDRPSSETFAKPQAAIVWAALLCFLPGCGGEGYFSHLVHGPDKIPAVFTLADRPTLILVDDPADVFNDPNMVLTVAINVEFHLKQNKVLADKIISVRKLADLQGKYGEKFKSMPIDAIGREAGAEQVIYVLVEDVRLEQMPGIYRPKATAQVKVIDAATGRRLFPDPLPANAPPSPTPVRGLPVTTELQFQGSDVDSRGQMTQMVRKLAEVLGRDAARLFYRWTPPEIGSRFEEP